MGRRSYIVQLDSHPIQIAVEDDGAGLKVHLNGKVIRVDQTQIGPNGALHLLMNGKG